ncbi:MAG: HU family DNA-binding protein [Kiritimatiellae bacterium]|nr:HU family DNA-binding protein [Kiritimatiellia bacterium]
MKFLPRTKVQTIRVLSARTGLVQAQVESVLSELASLAQECAAATGGFSVPGFGKIVLMKREARPGYNPRTGKPITIPPKTVVKFRLSKVAKAAILAKM